MSLNFLLIQTLHTVQGKVDSSWHTGSNEHIITVLLRLSASSQAIVNDVAQLVTMPESMSKFSVFLCSLYYSSARFDLMVRRVNRTDYSSL